MTRQDGPRARGVRWTEAEVMLLRELWSTTSDAAIGAMMGRSGEAVADKRRRLGTLKRQPSERSPENNVGRRWSAREDRTLAALVSSMSDAEIAERLLRTQAGVWARREELGIRRRPKGAERPWSEEEADRLMRNYRRMSALAIGIELGRTRSAVIGKWHREMRKCGS